MKPKDLIGKVIKTDGGNLKITKAKYGGIVTLEDGDSFVKVVDVTCECGAEFSASMEDIQSAIIED